MDEALLARLGEWRPAGPGPHALSAPLTAGGWSAHVTAEETVMSTVAAMANQRTLTPRGVNGVTAD